MNPRFTDEVVAGFYDEKYFRGGAGYSYYDEREAARFARHVWKKRVEVLRRRAGGGNLLDIGCSFGGFLDAASAHFTPYGIELSEYAGRHAKQRFGERIHIGTILDHPFDAGAFSAVTMIEVLEHLPDPVRAVRECCRLLGKGGILVVQTANMDGLQARILKDRYAYYMPGHLSYFSKRNLSMLLLREGFRNVRAYHPVEFGLLPKLLKSRSTFTSPLDYRRWFRITLYHYLSKVRLGDFAATSSMVLYAVK
jgi:2-polyprenyl-3-methyl-5-hydroxy-6-metoxy-1,4-benzoquinol methylase